jgi:hypothetical protein
MEKIAAVLSRRRRSETARNPERTFRGGKQMKDSKKKIEKLIARIEKTLDGTAHPFSHDETEMYPKLVSAEIALLQMFAQVERQEYLDANPPPQGPDPGFVQ